jgi:predicted CXXCH cytochrome family protein
MIRGGLLGAVVPVMMMAVTGAAFAQTETDEAELEERIERDSCITCHDVLPDERLAAPARHAEEDVHITKGLGCIACHGGDATIVGPAAMDPQKGYIGEPERGEIPSVCARCHSNGEYMKRFNPGLRVDQLDEYRISVHGELLFEDDDSNVATCTGCHSVHTIKPPTDPRSAVHPSNVARTCGRCHSDEDRMEVYAIATDQVARYEQSIHWAMISEGTDLSAPTCNDCHGNHGAAPPGVGWVGAVCGQCHSMMADLFNDSEHARVFALEGNPGCVTCHDNHEITLAEDSMLGLAEGSICGECHTDDESAGRDAIAMLSAMDSLHRSVEDARELLHAAENAGMEVSQALFDLQGAQDAMIMARANVHSFDIEAVSEAIASGLEVADTASDRGNDALFDLRIRRLGLSVSVTIILLLIVGLVMKIREIDRRGERRERRHDLSGGDDG